MWNELIDVFLKSPFESGMARAYGNDGTLLVKAIQFRIDGEVLKCALNGEVM